MVHVSFLEIRPISDTQRDGFPETVSRFQRDTSPRGVHETELRLCPEQWQEEGKDQGQASRGQQGSCPCPGHGGRRGRGGV